MRQHYSDQIRSHLQYDNESVIEDVIGGNNPRSDKCRINTERLRYDWYRKND